MWLRQLQASFPPDITCIVAVKHAAKCMLLTVTKLTCLRLTADLAIMRSLGVNPKLTFSQRRGKHLIQENLVFQQTFYCRKHFLIFWCVKPIIQHTQCYRYLDKRHERWCFTLTPHTWTTTSKIVSESCVRFCTLPTPSAITSQLRLITSSHVAICSTRSFAELITYVCGHVQLIQLVTAMSAVMAVGKLIDC